MAKCLNCSSEADYIIKGKTQGQIFCKAHLPWFINLNKDLGTKVDSLAVVPAPVVVVEETPVEPSEPKKSSKKKEPKEPVVTKPAEEVVVEEEK
jgi:hypothetical protein